MRTTTTTTTTTLKVSGDARDELATALAEYLAGRWGGEYNPVDPDPANDGWQDAARMLLQLVGDGARCHDASHNVRLVPHYRRALTINPG